MNNRGIFKLSALVLVLLLALSVFAACSDDPGEDPVEPDILPDPDLTTEFSLTVDLYYVSTDYLVTGDESIEPLTLYQTEFNIEADDDDLVVRIVNALKEVPEDAGDCETMLGNKTIIDAYMGDDDIAYVNFSSEEMNGGSSEEELLIYQIVETLNASVAAEGGVQFLVDGEVVDSLMGHIDASEPIVSRLGN